MQQNCSGSTLAFVDNSTLFCLQGCVVVLGQVAFLEDLSRQFLIKTDDVTPIRTSFSKPIFQLTQPAAVPRGPPSPSRYHQRPRSCLDVIPCLIAPIMIRNPPTDTAASTRPCSRTAQNNLQTQVTTILVFFRAKSKICNKTVVGAHLPL
eukprot:Filipodium_phascolosomae@DN2750_c0_g1_i4.p1